VSDLLDENPILKRHFATRKKVYQEAGGTIENYLQIINWTNGGTSMRDEIKQIGNWFFL